MVGLFLYLGGRYLKGNDDLIHIKQPKTYEEQIELFKRRGLIKDNSISDTHVPKLL